MTWLFHLRNRSPILPQLQDAAIWRILRANAIGDAKFFRRSHRAVIRVYDSAGNVIETHEHAGDFKEW
jgi:hypothetical protein